MLTDELLGVPDADPSAVAELDAPPDKTSPERACGEVASGWETHADSVHAAPAARTARRGIQVDTDLVLSQEHTRNRVVPIFGENQFGAPTRRANVL